MGRGGRQQTIVVQGRPGSSLTVTASQYAANHPPKETLDDGSARQWMSEGSE